MFTIQHAFEVHDCIQSNSIQILLFSNPPFTKCINKTRNFQPHLPPFWCPVASSPHEAQLRQVRCSGRGRRTGRSTRSRLIGGGAGDCGVQLVEVIYPPKKPKELLDLSKGPTACSDQLTERCPNEAPTWIAGPPLYVLFMFRSSTKVHWLVTCCHNMPPTTKCIFSQQGQPKRTGIWHPTLSGVFFPNAQRSRFIF